MSDTPTRRIAQLVMDLKELNVIQPDEDKIDYSYTGRIRITTKNENDKGKLYVISRYKTMYQAFLEEFSSEERVSQKYDYNLIEFEIRGKG